MSQSTRILAYYCCLKNWCCIIFFDKCQFCLYHHHHCYSFLIERELTLPLLFHNDRTDTSLTTIITNYNIMYSNSVSFCIIKIIIPIIVTAIPLDGSWRCLYCSGGEAGTWESYTSGETSIPFFFSQHRYLFFLTTSIPFFTTAISCFSTTNTSRNNDWFLLMI